MGTSIPGLLLHLAAHPGLHGRRRGARLAALVLCLQAIDAVLLEALFPAGDGRRGCPQRLLDFNVAKAIGEREDQPCAKDISRG
jgi:hypothetical protein